MKTEPLPGSRVCVAYTSSLYQDSNKGDTEPIRVSFNLQWLAVLGEANVHIDPLLADIHV